MQRKIIVLLVLLFGHEISMAQESFEVIDKLRKYNLNEIDVASYDYDLFTNKMIEWRVDFLKNFDVQSDSFESLKSIKLDQEYTLLGHFLFNLNNGDYYLYKFKDNTKSRNSYLEAFTIAEKAGNSQLLCEAIKKILNLNRHLYLLDNNTSKPYLKIYEEIAYDQFELTYYKFYDLTFLFQYFKLENWNFETAEQLEMFALKSKNHLLNGVIYQLLANFYGVSGNFTMAIKNEKKAIMEFEQIPFNYKSTKWKNSHIGLTRYLIANGDFIEAQSSISKIKSKPLNKIEKSNERFIFYYQSVLDSINNDYANAYINLSEYTGRNEKTLLDNNQIAYNELEAKYQTAEKEKQILLEQQKNRRNRNIAFGLGTLLLFGAITFYLIQKNTKRKQLLAEQEKELQVQKVGTLMKEQELTSIDAMIAGQEKERQRIANDLHDDLGGLMATVKLHFNVLKDKPSSELYEKTNTLLDEAYQKVRSIAHAKNSGVIAKDGLLKSVNEMAEKVSSANNFHIEVIDHGLENRLENSLELTIFRITQELITNVIKHANATEAVIHLTQHQDSLNIMVEDNGKGFNPKQILKKKGMGISSIDKRIDHLNGTFSIDSEPNKGTTIIIDIPI